MKNKQWYVMLVMLLMGALLLSACGGSGTGAEPVVEERPAEEEVAPEAVEEEAAEEEMAEEEASEEEMSEEETSEEEMSEEEASEEEMAEEEMAEEEIAASEYDIFLTVWADDTRSPILSELADGFANEYGVGLVIEQVADIRDQFKIAAPAGEGPDIIVGAHDWIGELVASGLLAELDLGSVEGNMVSEAVSAFYYEGIQVGMPYATENLAFFRNTDLVPDAPATWEEVTEIGTTLLGDGTVDVGIALSGTTYDAYPIQTAFGGYIFGRDDTGNYNAEDVGLDSDGMIAAASLVDQWVQDGFITDSTDWDNAHVLFEEGKAPFIMAGPWALNRIRESGVPYAISAFPAGDAGPGVPFLGVQGFMVNALSDNVALAQAFLTEFVATDATMQALYDADPRPSAWTPVRDAVEDPDFVGFGEASVGGQPMPAIPAMGAVWASWDDAFTLILQGEQTPDEAMGTAGEQIRTLIEEGG